MSTLAADVADRREQISVGTLQTELVLRVQYQTERYTDTLTASVPVTITGNTYWLEEDLSASNSHSTPVEREVTTRNTTLIISLAGLGAIAFAGAVGIGYWHAQGPNLKQLDTELTTSRYEEWISEGELPTGTAKQYIYINSLEDLVDVAIDSNKRVIHDPEFNAYSVMDGNMVYYYAEEPTMLNSWLELSPDEE